jgi:hypothetical protein
MSKSRNAIAPWAGYIYQGNVGLYVALKKIAELQYDEKYSNSEDLIKELQKWSLVNEGEQAEDFDIRRENQVISRHQVKRDHSKDVSKYSNYRTPRSTNHNKGFECEGAKSAKKYLHTIVDISEWWDVNTNDEWVEKGRETHTFVSNTSGVKLYKYEKLGKSSDEGDQFFCEVEKLEVELEKQLDNFQGTKLSLQSLVGLICDKVLSTKAEAVLRFDKIYEFVTGTSEEFKEYDQYQAQVRMVNTIHSIVDEMYEDDPSIDLTKLDDFIDELLQSKDWRVVMQKVIIDYDLGDTSRDPVYQKGFKQVYFEFIQKLNQKYSNFQHSYRSHAITSITDDEKELNSLRKRISEIAELAPEMTDILFEHSYLVNKNIEGEHLIPDEQNISEEFQKIMNRKIKMTSSDSIVKHQNMQFKRVDTLIQEVKDQSL